MKSKAKIEEEFFCLQFIKLIGAGRQFGMSGGCNSIPIPNSIERIEKKMDQSQRRESRSCHRYICSLNRKEETIKRVFGRRKFESPIRFLSSVSLDFCNRCGCRSAGRGGEKRQSTSIFLFIFHPTTLNRQAESGCATKTSKSLTHSVVDGFSSIPSVPMRSKINPNQREKEKERNCKPFQPLPVRQNRN